MIAMNALGRHILAEYYSCDISALDNITFLEKCMREAVEASGATIIDSKFHQFSPYGVSGVIVIAESHMAIHTWPEYGYCAVDIFTCGDTVNGHVALDYLKENLGAANASVMEIKRGVLDLPQSEIRHKPDQDAA